jgi:hypothetical protein
MSSPTEQQTAGEPGSAASQQSAAPSEEQMRAAYEAELSRIASVDLALQAAASLLNIGAHRLGLTGASAPAGPPAPEDLVQVRDAIDAVRGLLPVIERSAPAELRPLRDALSQLQMAYSRILQAAPAPATPAAEQGTPVATPPPAPATGEAPPSAAAEDKPGPGPAESSGRLWVPGR